MCNQWIAVKERLPEIYERILFVYDGMTHYGNITGDGRSFYNRATDDYYTVESVEYWQPLPAPPTGA